jgi:hypothetical protein
MAVHFYTVSTGNALTQMCGLAIYRNPACANPLFYFPTRTAPMSGKHFL